MKTIVWTGEALTVGELRRALDGLPDDAEVLVLHEPGKDASEVDMLSFRDRGETQGVTFYIETEPEAP